MLDQRFNGNLDSNGFLKELSSCCLKLLDENQDLSIHVIPHIWRDLSLISELLLLIPDSYLRRRFIIGELYPTSSGLQRFIDTYKAFDFVYGMRFHSNVCPIGMGIPSSGLYCYPQISHLYDELNLHDRLIDVRNSGFGSMILNAAMNDYSNLEHKRLQFKRISNSLQNKAIETLSSINSWLHSNSFNNCT